MSIRLEQSARFSVRYRQVAPNSTAELNDGRAGNFFQQQLFLWRIIELKCDIDFTALARIAAASILRDGSGRTPPYCALLGWGVPYRASGEPAFSPRSCELADMYCIYRKDFMD
ncbi:hypothetical protein [Xanthomonas perforans]|uniref:hypothetical protein n=1 Tax=Xanthomonas perforans TaxID=442694 RepID=UPI00128E2D0D|nr:hypothetical protein [Xanthomonas perforans]